MLEMHLTKATAVSESKGLGMEPPVARGQRGFGGRAPDAVAILQLFSKIRIFRHILV